MWMRYTRAGTSGKSDRRPKHQVHESIHGRETKRLDDHVYHSCSEHRFRRPSSSNERIPTIMGTWHLQLAQFIRAAASSPFSIGMKRSMNAKAYSWFCMARTAAEPSWTKSHCRPRDRINLSKSRQVVRSSSAMRTFMSCGVTTIFSFQEQFLICL